METIDFSEMLGNQYAQSENEECRFLRNVGKPSDFVLKMETCNLFEMLANLVLLFELETVKFSDTIGGSPIPF
jgi:hypothetical protein